VQRFTQDQNDDVHVKVGAGWSHDDQVPTSDFIIAYRDGSGDHEHVVIDDRGNVIHDTTGSLDK
jgi:hypothetical protein